jgi:hypothetical protein
VSEGGITDGKKSACDAASGWRLAGKGCRKFQSYDSH